MHDDLQPVSIHLSGEDLKDPKKVEAFNEMMQLLANSHSEYVDQVQKDLDVAYHCACDVAYLRSRSRWTQRMEDELIRLHRAGTPPNIYEWPPKGSPLRD